jgi:hypothetical protein
VGKSEGKFSLGNLGVDGNVIFKYLLNEEHDRTQIGFI